MIVCFSGTGNTLHVARLLAEKIGQDVFLLEGDVLQNPQTVELSTKDTGEPVVWAFPTYSWGIPPVVVDFIKNVGLGAGTMAARHFMLTTCGDDMGLTDRQWRRLMKDRGLRDVAAFAVVMPNTYVCMKGFDVDSPEIAEEKIAAADSKIGAIADAIDSGGPDMLVPGAFAWIKTRVVYPWFMKYKMSAKPFGHTAGCTGCGTCARLCPMSNISMSDDASGAPAPVWGSRCAMCLRCYHACPHHAVAYGKATDGKGRQWLGMGRGALVR